MNKVTVKLENATTKDYHELKKILDLNGIHSEISHKEYDDQLGLSFDELIILLPLLVPFAVEVRKAFEAYLDYKKSQKKKTIVHLEKNNKTLKISSENEEIPSLEDFNAFFD